MSLRQTAFRRVAACRIAARRPALLAVAVALLALVTLHAAAVSTQQADSFARKIALISRQSATTQRAGAVHRTPVSEDEVNSWFAYRSQAVLPQGLADPRLTIVGNGKVMGVATVDLDAVAKRRSSGGGFDPFGLIGGKVPVTVSGVLHTQDGQGRFELQSADVSGLPVPKVLLQELLSYYSRTPEHPDGVRLDDAFALPANIQQIEVGAGQAVVVQ
jgi:hypothetical protein